jgi:hypothetical protein
MKHYTDMTGKKRELPTESFGVPSKKVLREQIIPNLTEDELAGALRQFLLMWGNMEGVAPYLREHNVSGTWHPHLVKARRVGRRFLDKIESQRK